MAIRDKRKTGLYLSGQPIPISELNIILTQPTVEQIVLFNEDDFRLGTGLLINTADFINVVKMGNFELEAYSDFHLLLIVIRENEMLKELLTKLLSLLFPDYEIQINENEIRFFIEKEEHSICVGMINIYNFQYLQDIINDLFYSIFDTEEDYNPANDAAAKIAEKLKAGRRKVQDIRAKQDGDYSVFALYTSILSIGLNMDINIFYKYTPFQLYDSFKRYFLKVSADYYQKLASTPLMDISKVEKPEEWTVNIYK